MLRIKIPKFMEFFDERDCKFISFNTGTDVLCMEHSLVSLSEWESKWHIPYLDPRIVKTEEQAIDYMRCMCMNRDEVNNDLVFSNLGEENYAKIAEYIQNPMTATWFSGEDDKSGGSSVITSEVIYGWMVGLQIPFECQNWHLNRLLTLVKVCNENNKEPDKGKQKVTNKMLADRAALNAKRRAELNSKG